ncbi:cation:proton antiporter [Curtobacterium sp. MCBD17_040]|uniref:cation:proton antiporter n=1 Tax=Curtobacterium sp. MCBD17_040 TaxID=2175674 RepID=UPI000DAA8F30|nr:cation:proton antiporter [Curtobacterium sp. MCBD17_040]WIB63959.1 cation:proton antiporter [Curtobacterium sp. MCBD17_040]
MHLGGELLTIGGLFLIAYVLGRLGKLIGLPAIPIYMVVGLIASPHSTWIGLSIESHTIELIATFGLVLLLFNLGLEFDQEEFYGNAGKLLVSGGTYVAINMGVGFAFGFSLGWGTREALVVAGMTATSSSAIVTKLLIELRRLANDETPMILGVTVIEDVFIAIYLAIVSVVLSGDTNIWAVVGKLALSFGFLIVMFSLARWGGRFVSRAFNTRDDELFTVLFFGLAVLFGGLGDLLGVTDAIGAFVIGLLCGATRYRDRIEQLALPMRDVFGAFFFVNFGLGLDVSTFGVVVWPVLGAVLMTVVLNAIAGQVVARMNGFGAQAGINTAVILVNRGEFALILATLSAAAGLEARITAFAGLYVLVMAILGPLLAVNADRIGLLVLRPERRRARARTAAEQARRAERDRMFAEEIALVEAAGSETRENGAPEEAPVLEEDREPVPASPIDLHAEQAGQQSDVRAERQRDPEY